jgi:formate hydrogenlyase subunit 4
MERIGNLLRQKEFHLLLFFVCVVLFSWPIVSFSDLERLKTMFVYLFVTWALLIPVKFLVSRTLEAGAETKPADSDK